MKIHLLTSFVICLISSFGFSQDSTITIKHRFPIWTFHDTNVNVYGISTGFATLRATPKNVNTIGIKLEAIGIGLALSIIPESPIAQNKNDFENYLLEPVSERVYGISLSPLGSVCDCITNGLTIGGFGQIYMKNNGVSFAGMMNFVQEVNGLQFALFMNETFITNGIQAAAYNRSNELNGIQVGIYNTTKKLKGIQIGLWNVNSKRKLPLINWSFK